MALRAADFRTSSKVRCPVAIGVTADIERLLFFTAFHCNRTRALVGLRADNAEINFRGDLVNPFKPSPEKKLEAARASRDKLAERLTAAELAIVEHQAAAQRLARDGALDAQLDDAEAALRASRDRRDTLSTALADLNQKVAALERERDELADRQLRAETAAVIEALAVEITTVGTAFDAGLSKLGEACGRAAELVYDAKGLEVFAVRVRSEVPATLEMISRLLRDRARATIDGSAPATLPGAVVEPKPLPPPTTERVFLIRHVKWTNAARQLCIAEAIFDADLPIAVAARALKSGAALQLSDPRRRKLGGTRASRVPDPKFCESLDADSEQRASTAVAS